MSVFYQSLRVLFGPRVSHAMLLLAVLLLPGTVDAQDPPSPNPADPPKPSLVSKITFPVIAGVTPQPVAPAPGSVPLLNAGSWYVATSDVEFYLLASPPGKVTITYEDGPIKLRGIFADGSGKVETRTFKSKYLAIVDVNENQSGQIELIGVPKIIAVESDITRQLVDIGVAPQPPPVVIVPPVDPKPPVPVIPAGDFRAMLISESSRPLTMTQQKIFLSPKIKAYLDEKCVKHTSGKPEWRRWDPDIEIAASESATMRDMWLSIKPKLQSLPAIAIAKGASGFVFPLPNSEEDALALLKQYAEAK